MSIYDRNTGHLLEKSIPARNAVLNYEPTHMTFIQPILSNPCSFKESRYASLWLSDKHVLERSHLFTFAVSLAMLLTVHENALVGQQVRMQTLTAIFILQIKSNRMLLE